MTTLPARIDTSKRERRTQAAEIRAIAGAGGAPTKITGYAALFNTRSEDLGGFVEVIKPGAFAKALRNKPDVRCLFNHDANQVLGRTTNGTLRLTEDARGLAFECDIPATTAAADVAALLQRGDVSQCSFAFTLDFSADKAPTNWSFPSGEPAVREILEVDQLFDVGPVTYPAYEKTEATARSFEQAREEARKTAAAAAPRAAAAKARLAITQRE